MEGVKGGERGGWSLIDCKWYLRLGRYDDLIKARLKENHVLIVMLEEKSCLGTGHKLKKQS